MCTPRHLWETSEKQICDSFLRLLPANANILDVGCGDGFATNYMQAYGMNVVGCDKKPGPNQMDVSVGIKADDESFDAVWFAHVLEHLKNPVQALLEISRVCVTNGLVAVLVPRDDVCRPGHIWHFQPDYLIYLLARCGFYCGRAKIILYGYSIATIVVNARKGYIEDEQFNENVHLPPGFPDIEVALW